MENHNVNVQNNSATSEVVSVKEWIITILILMIPLVNIVMPFVWAFSSNTNPSKANYFKAFLIMMVVWIIIMMVFGASIISSIIMMSQY